MEARYGTKKTMTAQSEFLEEFLKQRRMLFSYVYSIVRDHHVAEDIFQSTLLIAFEKRADFKKGTRFGAWVRTIARYEILKLKEKNRRTVLLDEDALEAIEQAHTQLPERHWLDWQTFLEQCLEKLTPRNRALVEYRYRDQMGFERMADLIQSTANSIQVVLSKVRKQLRTCIEAKDRASQA